MTPRTSVVLGFVAFELLASGCARTLAVATVQTNPLAYPPDTLRQSEKLHIDIRDMDFPRVFKLRQSAYFAVVSRDRLRFHITLTHKWEEMADIKSYHVRLEDDLGHVYTPETVEQRYNDHVTRIWDHELRTAIRNRFGDIVGLRGDAYKRPVMLDAVDVFQGSGDYVFFAEDILNRKVKKLTLSVERAFHTSFRFTWNLVDDPTELPIISPDEAIVTSEQ